MRDRVRIWAKGGEGGNGCWSYRRTRTDRFGKPDGGNGGRGGDVILECSSAVWDFSNLQHHLNAKGGGNGVSKNKIGSHGSDKVVQVPVGTVIHLVSGETPELVVDTSIKSLQPWEIPDDQADPSTDDSASPTSKGNARKSVGLHHKVSGTPSNQSLKVLDKEATNDSPSPRPEDSGSPRTTRAKRKTKFKEILTRHRSDDGRVIAEEYEIRFEGENEEEGEEDEDCEKEEEEEEVEYSVAELTKPGERLVIARGGEGGLGNVCLRKGSKFHKINMHEDASSDTESEDSEDNSSLAAGIPGSESVLTLELKSIADVGLVGMPNAGKSTLLGALSRAKPTVGHYAFTTLRPNIGNLNYDDFFSVTVADIPGLIKGAHENRGLGHAFLRHIERTKVLAYVVDLAATLNGGKGIVPWEQLRDLVSELEHHQEGLSHRPSLVVANKIDEEGAEDVYKELKRRVKGVPIFPVCAVLEEGVPDLKEGLRRLMDGSESKHLDINRIKLD